MDGQPLRVEVEGSGGARGGRTEQSERERVRWDNTQKRSGEQSQEWERDGLWKGKGMEANRALKQSGHARGPEGATEGQSETTTPTRCPLKKNDRVGCRGR